MNNNVSLDSVIHRAVVELDNRRYAEYIQSKNRNKLAYPGEKLNENISKIIDKEEKKGKRNIFTKRLAKTIVCFAFVFSGLSGTFLTAEAVRESVATVAIEWYEKFTRTTIEADNAPTELPEIELGYIPEGYETYEVINNNKENYYHNLTSKSGESIIIIISLSNENTSYNFDNERNDYYRISLDKQDVLWIYDKNYNSILTYYDNILFRISGDVSLNELIKIYENIKFL